MTPQEARSEIERTTNALAEAGLAVDFNLPILRRDGPEVIVTWPAAPPQGRVFSEGFLASIQEYRQLVVQRQYTCALVDGALVQISFTFRNAEMIRNRLCYYPCPLTFQAGDWDPTEIPLLDVFDTVLVDEFDGVLDGMGDALPNPSPPRLRMRGPIRFDYAPEQQAETHPASHAHIGGDDARLPVFGPLSIGHFVRFVVRHFYPDAWNRLEVLRKWPLSVGPRCVTQDEEQGLFFECKPRLAIGAQ